MAKLIVNPTSASRREILLPRSVLSIGRDPSNDLVLPDAMVSRRHAVVEYRGSQYFIRDCNSSNGSLVNGDRVSERSLRDGDLVAIGTARLLFRDDVEIEETSAKVVQHPSAPRLSCPSCAADSRKGDLFCRQCGTSLAPAPPAKLVCAACGTAVPLPARFCNACGRELPVEAAAHEAAPIGPPASAGAGAASGAASAAAASEPASLAEPRQAEPIEEMEVQEPEAEPAPELDPLPAKQEPARTEEGRLDSFGPKAAEPPRAPAHILSSPVWQARPNPVEKARGAAPAGFGLRLAAGLVDGAIVSVGEAILLGPGLWYWWGRELPGDPSQVPFLPILLSLGALPIAAALAAAYFVHGWGVSGATVGKRLFGLTVETSDGASPIGAARALVRLLGCVASGLLLGLGFLMIAFTGEGLHDKIAGTRVVRREGD
jgi:uncharacterized RDD family membrane protein YckC